MSVIVILLYGCTKDLIPYMYINYSDVNCDMKTLTEVSYYFLVTIFFIYTPSLFELWWYLVFASLVVVNVFVDGYMDWVRLGDWYLDLLLHFYGVGLLHFIRYWLLHGIRYRLFYYFRNHLKIL